MLDLCAFDSWTRRLDAMQSLPSIQALLLYFGQIRKHRCQLTQGFELGDRIHLHMHKRTAANRSRDSRTRFHSERLGIQLRECSIHINDNSSSLFCVTTPAYLFIINSHGISHESLASSSPYLDSHNPVPWRSICMRRLLMRKPFSQQRRSSFIGCRLNIFQ